MILHKKMKFSIKDLVTFTEEILMESFIFCALGIVHKKEVASFTLIKSWRVSVMTYSQN